MLGEREASLPGQNRSIGWRWSEESTGVGGGGLTEPGEPGASPLHPQASAKAGPHAVTFVGTGVKWKRKQTSYPHEAFAAVEACG